MATVLIVGEGPAGSSELVMLLQRAGHHVLQAGDGPAGLAVARANGPELIIADWLLPTTDAGEVTRQLRGDPVTAAIPVLIMAPRYHEPAARAVASRLGLAGYLTRPFDRPAVLRLVNRALGSPAVATAEETTDPDPSAPPPVTALIAQVERLQRENERLAEALRRGSAALHKNDPRHVLERLAHDARGLVGARFATVGVPEDSGRLLHQFVAVGMDERLAMQFRPPARLPAALAAALHDRCPRRLLNPGGDPSVLGVDPSAPRLGALLTAPVGTPTLTFGWLCLFDKVGADAFTDEDERLAGLLASQAGWAYADAWRCARDAEESAAHRRRERNPCPEARFRAIVEASPHGIVVVQEGAVSFANAAAAGLLGYARPEDVIGLGWECLVSAEDRPVLRARMDACLRDESVAPHSGWKGLRRDGTAQWVESVARAFTWQGRPAVLSFLGDAGPRQRLEAQFLQAQKMEPVGRLAGGVAHDFNNLLTVIIGCCDLALAQRPQPPLADLVQEVRKAGERAALLTRQLLVFSRKQPAGIVPTDVAALLADTARMLGRLIGEDVVLRVACQPNLPSIRVDPAQLKQVVLNLAINARDAMPRGGQLIIEVSDITVGADDNHASNATRSFVLLTVSDTGTGMDAATRARLFEPFFTTKDPGRGTGLGLATVATIVRRCGGRIDVFSEPGIGTMFRIYLPRDPATSVGAWLEPPRPYAGSETILLVSADGATQALARLVLRGNGYTIVEARDGQAALSLASGHDGPIHLLVADAALPDMAAVQLAEELQPRWPGLRLLILSGPAAPSHDVAPPAIVLTKPFTPEALARQIRAMLHS